MLSRRFWSYVHRHRRSYAWGYAAVVASILMAQLSPWALKLAVDAIRQGAPNLRLLGFAAALIALALAKGRLSADEAWAAAHVDEDWNIAQWGEDELAKQRHTFRLAEFRAAAMVLTSL